MNRRADAHIHLFEGGFQGSFTSRPGVHVDEPACYESFMADHDITAALVVGFALQDWCATNNAYLARQVVQRPWVYPTAFVNPADPPSVASLELWKSQGFVGITNYTFADADPPALAAVNDDVWRFCAANHWLVSVNSRGEKWSAWRSILDHHPDLRLLVSHLGLPPRVGEPPTDVSAMRPIVELARYAQVRVKLSGFYALSDPGYDYPHRAAWPYVESLIKAFGCDRLLWASDFSPCLNALSFPQTLGVIEQIPFFTADDRRKIEGDNLLALLKQARS
jgi:predicted TIM-barrel fold metal-dependent hydrolase